MNCTEFLYSYSDFRDGVITDARKLRYMREHLTRCLACARYDTSVRHGVSALGEIEPSADFRERLRQRIAATAGEPMEPIGRGTASVAAALMLAAAVALLIYSRGGDDPMVAVPVAQTDPGIDTLRVYRGALPAVVVNPGLPFVTFDLPNRSPYFTVGGAAGTTGFQTQGDAKLGDWANLPH